MGEVTKIEERPILFSGEMVRAILSGSKTMTRRVVKQEIPIHVDQCSHGKVPGTFDFWSIEKPAASLRNWPLACPYGKPGDRLWVRETFSEIPNQKPSGYFTDPKWINRKYWYAADNDKPMWGGKWKSPRYMPRVAARILLEITDIRVERLQEITEEDAIAEGFVAGDGHPENGFHTESPYPAVAAFRSLWDQLNGNRGVCKTCKGHGVVPAWSGSVEGGSLAIDSRDCPDCKGEDKSFGWDQNPWVWIIEFRRAT